MTLLTVLTIQEGGDNIRCEVLGQDRKTGKWAGAVNLYYEDNLHTPLLTSNAEYDSREAAVATMEDVVRQVRAIDLFAQLFSQTPLSATP